MGLLRFQSPDQATVRILHFLRERNRVGCLEGCPRSGVEIPKRLTDRAIAAIHRQRLPDHSYLYGEYLKYKPRAGSTDRPAASGDPMPATSRFSFGGDKTITDEVHKICLDRLIKRNGWLDMGRKRPVPHESWFAVAGYFFYYGHLYASFCIETLHSEDRPIYRQALASILVPLQEKDGSWWIFPFTTTTDNTARPWPCSA